VADEQVTQLLFVYGSLKRGRSNHHQLHAAEYVADARTAPCFALHVVAGYPALVPGAQSIVGELYRVGPSAWSRLDAFEGKAYQRDEIELANGERALAYLSSDPSAGDPFPGDEWPSR